MNEFSKTLYQPWPKFFSWHPRGGAPSFVDIATIPVSRNGMAPWNISM